MQDYYDYSGHNKEYPPAKRGPGGIILAVILSLLVGLLIGALLLPGLFRVDSSVFDDVAPPWWKREVQEPRNTPVMTEMPTVVRTPRPERDLPAIGGNPTAGISGEFYNPVPEIAQNVGPSVVGVLNKINLMGRTITSEVEQSAGSGIIISADGYIVTNNHVVSDADAVYVVMNDGEEIKAEVVGTDVANDLAVIKIERNGLRPVAIGKSSEVCVGELAIAIGNPMGVKLAGTVTVGYISALERVIYVGGVYMRFMQTDAAINPGNSGGALVNSHGQLIGINSAKSFTAGYDEYGNSITTEGIGFAIPIDIAMPIIEQLIKYGDAVRPGIGITGSTVGMEEAVEFEIPRGIRVASVEKNGPAQKAGIQMEDIITGVDGKPITEFEQLATAIQIKEIGASITLEIWREGTTLTLEVIIQDINKLS